LEDTERPFFVSKFEDFSLRPNTQSGGLMQEPSPCDFERPETFLITHPIGNGANAFTGALYHPAPGLPAACLPERMV